MAALSWTLKVCGTLAMLSGTADLFKGPNLALDAVSQPAWAPSAVIDSQYRFFGAIWAGYGATLWWASNDVRARKTPLTILMGTMMLGGVGRLAAAAENGWGARLMAVFTGIEFALPLVVAGWAGLVPL